MRIDRTTTDGRYHYSRPAKFSTTQMAPTSRQKTSFSLETLRSKRHFISFQDIFKQVEIAALTVTAERKAPQTLNQMKKITNGYKQSEKSGGEKWRAAASTDQGQFARAKSDKDKI